MNLPAIALAALTPFPPPGSSTSRTAIWWWSLYTHPSLIASDPMDRFTAGLFIGGLMGVLIHAYLTNTLFAS